jgi:transposase
MTQPFAELSQAELDGLIERVKEAAEYGLALSAEDLQLLLNALLMLAQLQAEMAEQDITLHKLRKLAGIVQRSEKFKDIASGEAPKKPSTRPKPKPSPKPPAEPVVHERCQHCLTGLTKGQRCPECGRGTLYQYIPAVVLRISGQTPLKSTQHLLERLRCNTCGAYFTADLPEAVLEDGPADQQYGYSARALMGIQKYFAGAPFYRQQTLQQLFGMPVSASTVFDQCEQLANAIRPLFACLLALAGEAILYFIDDTTNRILGQGAITKPDRRTGKPKERSGVYTSGMIAVLADGQRCILYQTNVGHAGEWLDEILRGRPPTAPPPLVMSDALSHNHPSVVAVYHQALCNAHARREFVDLAHLFPDQVTGVLERYALIWENERACQNQGLSAAQRLAYHREHSLPVMAQLRDGFQRQLDRGEVEANSGLGQAMGYFIRHYEGLTAFCRIEGAPLDNNAMEQALKLIIRGRKNALFFKTSAGAAIADVITSVVATAHQAGVNAFDYLIVLQRHADAVKAQPERWLPWNYQTTREAEKEAA